MLPEDEPIHHHDDDHLNRKVTLWPWLIGLLAAIVLLLLLSRGCDVAPARDSHAAPVLPAT